MLILACMDVYECVASQFSLEMPKNFSLFARIPWRVHARTHPPTFAFDLLQHVILHLQSTHTHSFRAVFFLDCLLCCVIFFFRPFFVALIQNLHSLQKI